VTQRTPARRQGWFSDLVAKLIDVISSDSVKEKKNALVAMRIAIRHSPADLVPIFGRISQLGMKLWLQHDRDLVADTIRLMPVIAKICPADFSGTHLEQIMDRILVRLKEKE